MESFLIDEGEECERDRDDEWSCAKAGEALKATSGWSGTNGNGNNSSGFTALPGGYRSSPHLNFNGIGSYADFWSSSNYQYRELRSSTTNVRRNTASKSYGFSVRCVQ